MSGNGRWSVAEAFSLEGKVAVVTGGAGLYGRQIVAALALAGARTHVTTRSRERLAEIERSFREIEGVDITAHVLNQEDEASILALRDAVLERDGRVDVLVNNAVERTMRSWNDPLEAFEKSMKVNAAGLFAITRAFGDAMAAGGGGSIIMIGSIQGMIGPDAWLYEGMPFHGFIPDYFFHKGGMVNFTRFVAGYYGPRNVRCNCISPGGLATEHTAPGFPERYAERTMLGRMAGGTDLMGSIVFLASDASAYVTGVNLPVDGGYTAK